MLNIFPMVQQPLAPPLKVIWKMLAVPGGLVMCG